MSERAVGIHRDGHGATVIEYGDGREGATHTRPPTAVEKGHDRRAVEA